MNVILFYLIVLFFFNFRLYWLDWLVIKSLKINGMDIESYIVIKGVIKIVVYKVI